MSKVFLDTNLFIYALDPADKAKQGRARAKLQEALDAGRGVISTQVLQEYYVVATRKLGVAPLAAKRQLAEMEQNDTVVLTPALIHEAIEGCLLEAVSFWDSLILAAARAANCTQLWTEDLNHGQRYRGVEVVNPWRK